VPLPADVPQASANEKPTEAATATRADVSGWAGAPRSLRRYAGAAHTRTTLGFGTSGNVSADTELAGQLSILRARSRQLVRDNAYAKRAKQIVANNVVGPGVGLQGQVMSTRKKLNTRVNDGIETVWWQWCRADACHTGGTLHFSDLERVAIGEVFEAGEVLLRKHYRRFGRSRVPIALELIEAERLLDDMHAPAFNVNGNVRMGVELDEYQRPVAYYLRRKHPGDRRWQGNLADEIIRVPAAEIIHLKLPGRWPQTRGEPWMHTVVRKLDDIGEYSASEVQAARASAYYFGTIESPESANPLATDYNDGSMPPSVDIEPGQIQQLMPGEKLNFHTPTRPNTNIDPFLRYMLREVAAGVGVSYESLSRDYSQSNYSSSRLALLDDRDMWKVLQQWWIRAFREPLHAEWMQAAVMARAIAEVPLEAFLSDTERYLAVKWKPRGWSWVDPSKEQDAYAAAVRNGFMTVTDVVAQTSGGIDIEDVIATRRRELDAMAEAGIKVDTTVEDDPKPAPKAKPPPDDDEDQPDTGRPARLVSFGGRNG